MFRATVFAAIFWVMSGSMVWAAEQTVLPVWPDLDPALKNVEKAQQRGTAENSNIFIRDIAYPTITVLLPEKAEKPTPAILICPGGAYAGVAIDKEGFSVAKFLNEHGIAGVILKYRVPKPEETKDGAPLPLRDAREALRIIREHAKEWNVDAKKVGIMGFSAGGHLASMVITQIADDANARADFAMLGYPVISMMDPVAHKGSRDRLLGKNPSPAEQEKYSSELHVSDQTPPTFQVHALDDHVLPKNSEMFFDALQAHHVVSEIHLFATGGHGFGLGNPGTPTTAWPELFITWLKGRGILTG